EQLIKIVVTESSKSLRARPESINRTQRYVKNNQIVQPRAYCYSGGMKTRFYLLLAVLWIGALAATAQSPSIVGTLVLTGADKLLPNAMAFSCFGATTHGRCCF